MSKKKNVTKKKRRNNIKYIFPSGVEYKGSWKNGKKHGVGTMKRDDNIYKGTFKNNKYHGKGTLIWKTGDK